jgi:hypothetical protein
VLNRPVKVEAEQVFNRPPSLRDGPGDLRLHIARGHNDVRVGEGLPDQLDVVIGEHRIRVHRQHKFCFAEASLRP